MGGESDRSLKNQTLPSPTEPARSVATLAWKLGAWLALTVYFLLPPREAMSWGLDSSNYGSYAWMFAAGRQFGADTVAMTGPFGFLAYGHTYSGYLFFGYLVGDFLLKAAFAFLVVQTFGRLKAGIWRWMWLLALLVFVPSVDDLIYDIAVLLAAVACLKSEKKGVQLTIVVASMLLGFSGLMKGSHATLAGVSLLFVTAAGFSNGNRKPVFVAIGVALVTFLGGWMAAGQQLRDLPGYFQALFALTAGYNATMGLEPTPAMLRAGLTLAGLFSLALFTSALVARTNPRRLLLLLYFAFFGFLQWKHGFVRADGHVYMFFGFVAVAAPLLQMATWTIDPPARDRRKIAWSASMSLSAFLIAAVATISFSPRRAGELLAAVPARLELNLRYLASPEKTKRAREIELKHQRQLAELSDVRRDVGKSSIDFFGYEQGILLLNELNYRPRPMGGGSFNVYHPHLQRLNAKFMADAGRRPEFFLLKLQTIDGRLAAADDPLTLQSLLAFYQPVRAQRDYVLLEKKTAAEAPVSRQLEPRTIPIGEWLDVPEVGEDELLLFSVDVGSSFAGYLGGIASRPPLLTFEVEAEGAKGKVIETFRLAPLSARVPVLLSPLLENTSDFISLYGNGSIPKKVRRIRLNAPKGGFAKSATFSFSALPKPPAVADGVSAEIGDYLALPLSNRPPLALVTQQTGITELFGEPIALVHAPGSIAFPVQQNDQQFIFSFGIMPQAYDPGETDGVEFVVEYLRDGQPPQRLFSRLLQPRTSVADRGMQSARAFFPPQVSSGVVRVRTERGPAGNGAWDQSYVSHVQVKPGPFDPRQLFGFSVPPEGPGFPDPNPTLVDGREARMLPPPGELRFPIPPEAGSVTIGVGVLPTAYAGENHSDGIGCEVVLLQQNGDEKVIFKHVLDPIGDRRARGTVTLDLPLLPRSAGSKLAIRIDGGAKEDLRWDWSYVQTVRFR